jgi:anti-anti-sigma regulatory factor
MFHVREQQHHTTEVLTLAGPFDRRVTPGIQILILLAQKIPPYHLILDCSHITSIDALSFRRFFRWYRKMKSDRVQVSIVKPLAPILKQFHVWHVSECVQVYSSLEEATWNSTTYS